RARRAAGGARRARFRPELDRDALAHAPREPARRTGGRPCALHDEEPAPTAARDRRAARLRHGGAARAARRRRRARRRRPRRGSGRLPGMTVFTRIDHVEIGARDLPRAIDAYRRIGFDVDAEGLAPNEDDFLRLVRAAGDGIRAIALRGEGSPAEGLPIVAAKPG